MSSLLLAALIASPATAATGVWIPTGPARPAPALALFDPAPARGWAEAMAGLSRLGGSWEPWSALREPSPEILAQAAPLARLLEEHGGTGLRRRLEEGWPPRESEALRAELEPLRLAASSLAQAAAVSETARLARVSPEDAEGLREAVTRLEALRGELARLRRTGLYDDAPLAGAEDFAGAKSRALRGDWMSARLSDEARKLKSFIERSDGELLARDPALLHLKLRKAAAADFAFFRAFPNLQYALLAEDPGAARIARTPVLRLAGDLHAENVELVPYKGALVPQVNDFDDSALGYAALDLARAFAGAALLGDGEEGSMRALARQAMDGYTRSLRMGFSEWARSLAGEESVASAEPFSREWEKRSGPPLDDEALAQLLADRLELEQGRWRLFDRRGAGGSSIGLRRYLLRAKGAGHVHEVKELRASAVEAFTAVASKESPSERLEKAYRELRRVPTRLRAFQDGGADWLGRRREAKETRLALGHPRSAARVIGGLLAQLHRASGLSPETLIRARAAAPRRLIVRSAQAMRAMRQALIDLLNRGVWDLPQPPAAP